MSLHSTGRANVAISAAISTPFHPHKLTGRHSDMQECRVFRIDAIDCLPRGCKSSHVSHATKHKASKPWILAENAAKLVAGRVETHGQARHEDSKIVQELDVLDALLAFWMLRGSALHARPIPGRRALLSKTSCRSTCSTSQTAIRDVLELRSQFLGPTDPAHDLQWKQVSSPKASQTRAPTRGVQPRRLRPCLLA